MIVSLSRIGTTMREQLMNKKIISNLDGLSKIEKLIDKKKYDQARTILLTLKPKHLVLVLLAEIAYKRKVQIRNS